MRKVNLVKDPIVRRICLFFLAISAVLVVVAVLAARNISRSVATSDWVNHTHAVILETEALRSALQIGDAAHHTYAATGDARDQTLCRDSLASVDDHLELVQALVRQEPDQNEAARTLAALIAHRADNIRALLAARQSGDLATVRRLLDADAESLHDILRRIDKFRNAQLARLTERDTASYLQAQTTRWTVWAGVAVDVLLLGGVVWLLRDDIAARRRATEVLQEANAQLEVRVRQRTADLQAANGRLSTENLERQWANQGLEHQVRYNQLIIDSISDLVLVLTKALNISRVNPAVTHLTGLEPAALINQPLSRIVQLNLSGEAPMLDPLVQALKEGRDLRDRPAIVEDKRGRTTPARFTLFPLRDGHKIVGGIVTVQVDAPRPDAPAGTR